MTYFRLMDCNGKLHSGAPCKAAIEKRRASLIAENELKLTLERTAMNRMLGYTEHPRKRAAIYGMFRERLALLKDENKFWHSAPVETRTI